MHQVGYNLQEVLRHLCLLAQSKGVLGRLGEQEMGHTSGWYGRESEGIVVEWGEGTRVCAQRGKCLDICNTHRDWSGMTYTMRHAHQLEHLHTQECTISKFLQQPV